MRLNIYVRFKEGVPNPVLENYRLELSSEKGVQLLGGGKLFEITMNSEDETEVRAQAQEMCDTLLANKWIETASFELINQ